jgi:hypothetical protein
MITGMDRSNPHQVETWKDGTCHGREKTRSDVVAVAVEAPSVNSRTKLI